MKCIPKQTQEVITRQARPSRDFCKVERQLIRLVNELARATQALANIRTTGVVAVHDGRHSTSKSLLSVRGTSEKPTLESCSRPSKRISTGPISNTISPHG